MSDKKTTPPGSPRDNSIEEKVESPPDSPPHATDAQTPAAPVRRVQRGFLPGIVLIPCIEDPKQYALKSKWLLTSIVALGALAVPLSSGILFPVLTDIANDLQTSQTVVNLSIAFSSLAVAITPLWWSYLAEARGRRLVYLVSFFFLGVFNVLAAVSVNIGMLIAMRLLASAASASLQSVSAGTIADLWAPHERGRAMGLFMIGPMLGPMIAPVIGGALGTRWNWRSTQWFLVIYGFLVFFLMLFCIPETGTNLHRPQLAQRKSNRALNLLRLVVKPLRSITLLRFPAVVITVYYTGVVFATYYMLYISIEDVFSNSPHYHWRPVVVGCTYIPSALGVILGSVLGGRWTDAIMNRAARKAGRFDANGDPIPRPEDRIRENALVAAILFPGALLWYGWTAQKHIFWIVPLIATFFYGFAAMLITNITMTMLTEFVPRRSTTGVAVNNLVRNGLACVTAVITQPLIDAIGNGWTFTAVCFACLLSGLPLILLRIRREEWSERMRTAMADVE